MLSIKGTNGTNIVLANNQKNSNTLKASNIKFDISANEKDIVVKCDAEKFPTMLVKITQLEVVGSTYQSNNLTDKLNNLLGFIYSSTFKNALNESQVKELEGKLDLLLSDILQNDHKKLFNAYLESKKSMNLAGIKAATTRKIKALNEIDTKIKTEQELYDLIVETEQQKEMFSDFGSLFQSYGENSDFQKLIPSK